MLCRLVWGCCKKGGRLRSYFLWPSQTSGKRNQEVGMVREGSVSDPPVGRQAECLWSTAERKKALTRQGNGLVVSVVLSLIP